MDEAKAAIKAIKEEEKKQQEAAREAEKKQREVEKKQEQQRRQTAALSIQSIVRMRVVMRRRRSEAHAASD